MWDLGETVSTIKSQMFWGIQKIHTHMYVYILTLSNVFIFRFFLLINDVTSS